MFRFAFALCAALVAAGLAPAAAQSIDPAKRDAIRELIEITQVEQMTEQMLGMFNERVMPMLVAANPGKEDVLSTILQEELGETFREMTPEIVTLSATVWAKHFETGEIEELVDFYKTPLGRKLIDKQPVIMRESMQAGLKLGEQVAALAMEHVKQRLIAEDMTVPERL